jgi:hypothetical protein
MHLTPFTPFLFVLFPPPPFCVRCTPPYGTRPHVARCNTADLKLPVIRLGCRDRRTRSAEPNEWLPLCFHCYIVQWNTGADRRHVNSAQMVRKLEWCGAPDMQRSAFTFALTCLPSARERGRNEVMITHFAPKRLIGKSANTTNRKVNIHGERERCKKFV